MMNYSVQNTGRWKMNHPLDKAANWSQEKPIDGYTLHDVVENTTGQVIKTDITQSEAKALCRHLNMGGGFDSRTPAFFLERLILTDE